MTLTNKHTLPPSSFSSIGSDDAHMTTAEVKATVKPSPRTLRHSRDLHTTMAARLHVQRYWDVVRISAGAREVPGFTMTRAQRFSTLQLDSTSAASVQCPCQFLIKVFAHTLSCIADKVKLQTRALLSAGTTPATTDLIIIEGLSQLPSKSASIS
jgi:hypothetical protein